MTYEKTRLICIRIPISMIKDMDIAIENILSGFVEYYDRSKFIRKAISKELYE